MSATPYAGLLERLSASAKDFELPPSIQSMRNIRAIDAMNEAAEAISSLLALLEKAAPFVGWASTRQQTVAGVDASELCDEIDAALNSDASTQTVGEGL